MKSKFQIIVFLGIVLLLAFSAGCGGSAGTGGRTQLIVAQVDEPDIMDPQMANWTTMPHMWIAQPLVMFSMDLTEIVPDMATSWDVSDDGLVITWHLTEGTEYTNGNPVNAQALKDAWTRYVEVSPYAADLEPIIEMNVIDEYTLEAIHSVPPAYMWAVLATEYGAPFDASNAAEVGDETFSREPIGSGLFKIKEWVDGSYLLLERNENYKTNLPFVENKGPAHLEEVKVRFIPEDLTRSSELEAGTVDIVLDLPIVDVQRFIDNPDVEVYESQAPGYAYISFNHSKAPFDDLKLRTAVALAINRGDLVKTLDSTVDAQYSFLAPAQICYSEEMQQYAKDKYAFSVDAAVAMLEGAGWTDTDGDGIVDKDGEPLSVVLVNDADDVRRAKIGPVVKTQLEAVGIEVTIEMYAGGSFRDKLWEGEYDFALSNVSWPDPDILTYIVGLNGDNRSFYANPEVDALIDEGRYIMDLDARTTKYEEVQKILIDDVVFVPLYSARSYTGIRKEVKGLIYHASYSGLIFLNDVTIEE